ncbi:MAG: GMC family oxidoreductase [Planctomycetes bacterium]|nr:GMC family oxidoreductase [Planctomycetota bacterium]MCB9886608.1 GMC family oxidoreductase [Planctomycetota bacterium]
MTEELDVDVAVVGSGAGGSVVAYHAARSGARTLLLERGPHLHPRDISHDEPEMIARIYKDGGAQTNNAADMFVLQGSCVGGSTVLTNGVCLRIPEPVRRSFAAHGFELPADELARSHERVESVLNVHPLAPSLHNPAVEPLAEGFRRMGHKPGGFRKNFLDCIGCGYCNVGCRYGQKLDAAQTWVPMALDRGAGLRPDTAVERIDHHRGRVLGLLCRDLVTGATLRVRADRYVLGAGAIGTPELLLRSRIKTDLAGRFTSFHVGAIVFGDFPQPLDGFDGDQMCLHVFTDRFLIEQCQNPPVSTALTLPGWYGDHAQRMQRYRHLAALGVLVPTAPTGRVFLGLGHRIARRFFDHADVRFAASRDELTRLAEGMQLAGKAMLAAGATVVHPPLATGRSFASARDLDALPALVRRQSDFVGFGSSHPQGGARAGADPRHNVVGPDFRVHGMDNLFVADASVFPHALGVNPMLGIMAVADRAARFVLDAELPDSIDEGPAHRARQRLAGAAT